MLLSNFHGALEIMPSVLTAFKFDLNFEASPALGEKSFSCLKSVLTEHQGRLSLSQKARFIHLTFEPKPDQELQNRVERQFVVEIPFLR